MRAPRVHRFRDEWILALVDREPDVTHERLERWRAAASPFLAQCTVDTGVVAFDELDARPA